VTVPLRNWGGLMGCTLRWHGPWLVVEQSPQWGGEQDKVGRRHALGVEVFPTEARALWKREEVRAVFERVAGDPPLVWRLRADHAAQGLATRRRVRRRK